MKKIIYWSFLFIVSLGLATGCKPRYPNLSRPEETAPPFYKLGWEEGCETGLAAYGTSIYKTFYHFKQSPQLTTNNVYYQAWNDAFAYCRHFALRWANQGSIDEVDNIYQDRPFLDNPGNFYGW
ncbi:MAG: hypothetical protein IPP74_09460 [Alphaproteobacteria bacterium]|nr:hypothetical protein [Alphaproteobacteria bacterium]